MKYLILGNSGSGKTTLALRLAARYALTMLDLDQMVWSRTESAKFRPENEIARELERFLSTHESWVVEGSNGRWAAYLLPHCSQVVFLNPGEGVCVTNCRARPWEPGKYQSKAEQDDKMPLLLDCVRGYYVRSDEMSLSGHKRIFEAFTGPKYEITSNHSAADLEAIAAGDPVWALETERARLHPGHPIYDAALRAGVQVFRARFGWEVAEGLREYLQPPSKDAVVAAEWNRFLIVLKSDRKLVGFCACRKAPDGEGALEIAYGIAPGYQKRGLATEVARALTEHALARKEVKAVCAHTMPEENASTRVLAKCGFRLVGEIQHPEDGRIWRWESPAARQDF